MGQYDRFAADSQILAMIGDAFAGMPANASPRLPRDLAQAAVAAWRRDESDQPASPETEDQRMVRDHAATLALIGLAVLNNTDLVSESIEVSLSPELVAAALAVGNAQNR